MDVTKYKFDVKTHSAWYDHESDSIVVQKNPREFWLWNGKYYETHVKACAAYLMDTTSDYRLKGKNIIRVREVLE